MSAGGLQLDPEVLTTFEEVKSHRLSYAIYTINAGGHSIGVHSTGADRTYDDLTEALLVLPTPGYAVMNYRYTAADGAERAPIVFLLWCPDQGTPAKAKTAYASSRDTLYRALPGAEYNLVAVDESELREDIVSQIKGA